MSVSAGTGGTSVVGVVIGSGTGTHATSVLPFTGANHIVELVGLALVLILAGIMAVGLARRASETEGP